MDIFCKVYMPSIFVNAFFLSKQTEHTNLITFCLQLANTWTNREFLASSATVPASSLVRINPSEPSWDGRGKR